VNVVVGGSRFLADRAFVLATLDCLHSDVPITRLAHGDCDGADKLAKEWAVSRGVAQVPYEITKEQWRETGRSAGPKRNSRMLKIEKPMLVIAFPGGSGTKDLIRQARRMNFRVLEVAKY
jgi:hypothetical protein